MRAALIATLLASLAVFGFHPARAEDGIRIMDEGYHYRLAELMRNGGYGYEASKVAGKALENSGFEVYITAHGTFGSAEPLRSVNEVATHLLSPFGGDPLDPGQAYLITYGDLRQLLERAGLAMAKRRADFNSAEAEDWGACRSHDQIIKDLRWDLEVKLTKAAECWGSPGSLIDYVNTFRTYKHGEGIPRGCYR